MPVKLFKSKSRPRRARSFSLAETIVCCTPSDKPFELATKSPTLKTLGLAAVDSKGRKIFRKEVIYPGHFEKRDPTTKKTEVEFDVTQDMIKNWVKQHERMRAKGIDVPLPVQHSTDPEDRRGTVLRLAKEFNPERGVDCLYMYVRFRDRKAEKLAGTTQVSLFSPPDFVDGEGNEYSRPIRHVALTDYPVISGLDDFKVIAASFGGNFNTPKETDMTSLVAVAKRLGLKPRKSDDALSLSNGLLGAFNKQGKRLHTAKTELAALKLSLDEDEDEEDEDDLDLGIGGDVKKAAKKKGISLDLDESQLTELITKLIKKAMAGDDLGLEEDEDEEDEDDMDLEEDEEDEDDRDLEEDEDEEDEDDLDLEEEEEEEGGFLKAIGLDEDEEDEEMSFSFKNERTQQIRRKLAKKKRVKRKRALSLSSDVVGMLVSGREAKLEGLVNGGKITPSRAKKLRKKFCTPAALQLSLDSSNSDPFDSVCSALEDNKALSLGERTGHQSGNREVTNPLVADAERRAKAARGE